MSARYTAQAATHILCIVVNRERRGGCRAHTPDTLDRQNENRGAVGAFCLVTRQRNLLARTVEIRELRGRTGQGQIGPTGHMQRADTTDERGKTGSGLWRLATFRGAH